MNNSRYLFVSDQGHVFSSRVDPTPEDLAFADVGIVTVIRLADLFCYRSGLGWQPIPAGELASAEVEGKWSPPFHAMPSNPAGHISPVLESAPRKPRQRLLRLIGRRLAAFPRNHG